MAAIRHIYVQQSGGWWRLSLDEWKRLCLAAVQGRGPSLAPYRRIRSRPACARSEAKGGRCYSVFSSCLVVQPDRWTREDWLAALREAAGIPEQKAA